MKYGLVAYASVEHFAYGFSGSLTSQVNLQCAVNGRHAPVLCDDEKIVGVINSSELN
jgi:hypothetical protein